MKKRIISYVMTVVMAATIMVSVAPVAEVNATETTLDTTAAPENITVSYVVDNNEDKDLGNGLTISIPSSFAFSQDLTENTDMGVTLKQDKTSDIPEGVKVTVSVSSTNGYMLKREGGSETIPYTLKYEKTAEVALENGTINTADLKTMSATDAKLPELSKTGNHCDGVAAISSDAFATDVVSGTYTDVLTYSFEVVRPAASGNN